MKKQRRGMNVAVIVAIALLSLGLLASSAQAKPRGRQPQTPTSAIPEDQRPNKAIPWVLGGVFTVGAVLLGLKNAKRTHLD